jgi:hypothetical protein
VNLTPSFSSIWVARVVLDIAVPSLPNVNAMAPGTPAAAYEFSGDINGL